MENMINNVKRKKRKTRRCLDEIRKRAHSFNCRSISKESQNNVKASGLNTKSSNLSKNCITIQRLTLLPKTIRSETVTRPVLLENNSQVAKTIPQNKLKLDQKPNEVSNTIDINSVFAKKDIKSCNNSFKIDPERKDEILFSNESSPNSFVLFSPINNSELNQNDQSSSISHTSSPSSHDDYNYLAYEEFIDEIPMYLKHNAPSILNQDVIRDSKEYLRNLFIDESAHSTSQDEDNIYLSDNSINSSPEEILQNPKDYLRQRLYERNIMYGQDDMKESDSLSPKTPFSTQSPSCSPPTLANGQMQSIIQITPEYNFYPHKLN